MNKQMTKVAMVAVVGAGLNATDTLMPVEHSAKFDSLRLISLRAVGCEGFDHSDV